LSALSFFLSFFLALHFNLSLSLSLPYGGKKFDYLISINAEKIPPPPQKKKEFNQGMSDFLGLIYINLTPAEEEKK
jgi:hypothetical protein